MSLQHQRMACDSKRVLVLWTNSFVTGLRSIYIYIYQSGGVGTQYIYILRKLYIFVLLKNHDFQLTKN